MNKKQVIILWIIAAALGLAVAAVKSSQNKGAAAVTNLSRGDQLLADLPADNVTAVKVEGAGTSVNLEHTESGWVVKERDNFPANFQLLASTLRHLHLRSPGCARPRPRRHRRLVLPLGAER